MVLQLQNLRTRPELFIKIENEANLVGPLDGVIYTRSEPRALLSSSSSANVPGEISINLYKAPGAASPKHHYAGNGAVMSPMYFYTKKAGLFFEQNYLLVRIDVLNPTYHVIKETESPSVTFFHRQPFYLLRSGMLTSSWIIKHFQDEVAPISTDLTGVSLSDAIFIYNGFSEKVLILGKGRKERSELNEKVIIIQHPDLDINCTAYSDDWDTIVYVALSSKPELLIIHTETLAIETVQLPVILDIRHANSGLLIFAQVKQQGTEFSVGQLEDRYWKPQMLLEVQLKTALRQLEDIKRQEIIRGVELQSVKSDNSQKNVGQEKRKVNGLELAAANAKIDLLRKEVTSVQQELNNEKRRNSRRMNEEQQKNDIKEQEHQRKMKSLKEAHASEIVQIHESIRIISENGLMSIREERDRLAAENQELEGKYRKLLLLFGRQQNDDTSSSVPSAVPGTSIMSTVHAKETPLMENPRTERNEENEKKNERVDEERVKKPKKQRKKKNVNAQE